MNEKERLIRDYITKEECYCLCDSEELFDCASCSCFDECYMKAEIKCDIEFAESVDFGGYNTAEEFWEQNYQ